RALLLGVAILPTEQNSGASDRLVDDAEKRRRWADQEITGDVRRGRPVGGDRPMRQLTREGEPVLVQAVHLPVARHELAPRRHPALLAPPYPARSVLRRLSTRQPPLPIGPPPVQRSHHEPGVRPLARCGRTHSSL